MSWTVFRGARPADHLNVVENLHNIKPKRFWRREMNWAVTGDDGERGQAIDLIIWLHNIQTKKNSTAWKELGRVWGSTAQPYVRMFLESFMPSRRKLFQHLETSCTVLGGARPAVRLNLVQKLHNIKTKRFFNAANWAGPCQRMLGSAAQP